MDGWVGTVMLGAAGSLVASGIAYGWPIFWRWTMRWPDMRGDWTVETTWIPSPANTESDAVSFLEHVLVNRQLGPFIRGETETPTTKSGSLGEGRATLQLRGRFHGDSVLTYSHFQANRGKKLPHEVGAGLVKLAAGLSEATGYAANVGVESSEPIVFRVKMWRSKGPFG